MGRLLLTAQHFSNFVNPPALGIFDVEVLLYHKVEK
jgi:hypothetical protein